MPDYKRMVAYIYQYNNGNKAKNLGFARVESRNGSCRIVVSMRGLRSNRQDIHTVYTFVRNGSQMTGIPIGEFRAQNGKGIITLLVTPDNIQGSGYSLEQVGGIVITDGGDGFYATEWDDHPVNVREFAVFDTSQPRSSDTANSEEEQEPRLKSAAQEKSAAENQEQSSVQVKSEPQAQVQEEVQSKPQVQSQKAEQPESLAEGQEEVQSEYQAQNSEEVQPVPQVQKLVQMQPRAQMRRQAQMQRRSQPQMQPTPLAQVEELKQPELQEQSGMQNRPAEEEIIQPTVQEDVESQGGCKPKGQCSIENRYKSRDENWRGLQKSYPKIVPFEDDGFAECIRIEPKDLVHLPKEYWILGNNSFLLHGYYNYRYLILGRMANGEGYLLGVPGTFDNREHRMSRMFGFPDFVPAKKEGQRAGKFGYWCRKV